MRYLILFTLLILIGCGEENKITIASDKQMEGWSIKVEATVKAKSRKEALGQIAALLDTYAKGCPEEPLKAEEEPLPKKIEEKKWGG